MPREKMSGKHVNQLLINLNQASVMHESAIQNDIAPNDISFTQSKQIIKCQIIAFSPSGKIF